MSLLDDTRSDLRLSDPDGRSEGGMYVDISIQLRSGEAGETISRSCIGE